MTSAAPDLKLGDTGDWVVYLQQLLSFKGYWFHGETGTFNEELQDAVIWFQGDTQLVADGWVGDATWAALAITENLIEHDVDPNWAEEFNQVHALATAYDFDAFVRDEVGVDPELVRGIDECAETYRTVTEVDLAEHLRIFAAARPVPLSTLHGTLDWIDWTAVAMYDIGDKLIAAGHPEDGTRFRMRAGILETEHDRVRRYR
jgi:hypothetical protein